MQKYKKVIACLAGIAVVFIWSGWDHPFQIWNENPPDAIGFNYAAVCYGVVLCIAPSSVVRLKKYSLFQWLVVGLGVGFPYTLLSFYGLKTIGAAHAGVLVNGMLPVLGTVAAYFIFSQKIPLSQVSGHYTDFCFKRYDGGGWCGCVLTCWEDC